MRHKRGVSGTALPLHPRLVFTANQDGRLRGVQLENDVTLLPVLEKVRLDADPRVECLEVRPREVLDCDPLVGGCYHRPGRAIGLGEQGPVIDHTLDRKSTRLNSSHGYISYAVFCLKKKK